MASDAREITEARTRYAEEVASVVAPRGAGSKRRGHSGQGSPNQAGAEIAGETDGSRTLRWREPDSNLWSRCDECACGLPKRSTVIPKPRFNPGPGRRRDHLRSHRRRGAYPSRFAMTLRWSKSDRTPSPTTPGAAGGLEPNPLPERLKGETRREFTLQSRQSFGLRLRGADQSAKSTELTGAYGGLPANSVLDRRLRADV